MNSSFRFLATPQGVVLATAIVFALVLSLLNPAFFRRPRWSTFCAIRWSPASSRSAS